MPYRVFNLAEVAEYLHLPVAEVKKLVHDREIPFDHKAGREVFRKKLIDAWASQRILGLRGGSLQAYHKRSSARAHDLSKQHAILPELLKPEYVNPAMTSRTKASVIRDMIELAVRTNLVANPKDLLATVEQRERLCSTALGGGMALLHPEHQEPYMFEDSFVVVGRTIQPIPFGSPDGTTSDVFFLVCCQDDRTHLHVLARLCMMCHHTSVLMEIRDAESAKALHEAILASEREVIQQL